MDGEDRFEAELKPLYGKGSVCCGKASYWNDGAGQLSEAFEDKAVVEMLPSRLRKSLKSILSILSDEGLPDVFE